MGNPKVPTLLKSDKKCAHVILTGVLNQQQSKGMDMRLYWFCDKSIEQNKFHIYWKRGEHNLEGYPTKHHPNNHQITVRHHCVANAATTFKESFATTINQLQSIYKGLLNANPQRKRVL